MAVCDPCVRTPQCRNTALSGLRARRRGPGPPDVSRRCLAVRRARARRAPQRLVIAPRSARGLREAGKNVLVEQPFPGAEAPLAKVIDLHDRQPAWLGDWRRRAPARPGARRRSPAPPRALAPVPRRRSRRRGPSLRAARRSPSRVSPSQEPNVRSRRRAVSSTSSPCSPPRPPRSPGRGSGRSRRRRRARRARARRRAPRLRAAELVQRPVGVPCSGARGSSRVSPWRARRSVVTGDTLAAVDLGLAGPRLRRHRLDRRDRPRDGAAARRGGRAGRHVRGATPTASSRACGEALHVVGCDLSEPGAPEQLSRPRRREALGPRRLPRQQRRRRRPGALRGACPTSEWDAMWQLNVMSYVRAIRAALPAHARARRGRDRQRLLDRRASGRRPGCRTTP